MDDSEIHRLMTQSGCGGTLTPAVRRFALACRAAIYSAEQAQIEAPLRAEIDRLNAQRRELQAERERLLDSLARAGLEASRMVLKERDRCAKTAAPEHIPYSDDEWRVRCEVRDAILDA